VAGAVPVAAAAAAVPNQLQVAAQEAAEASPAHLAAPRLSVAAAAGAF
jgi:hypothetical protein